MGYIDDRGQWQRSRVTSWAAVIALHIAVLTALVLAPKTRIAMPAATAVELLTFPRSVSRPEPISPPLNLTPERQIDLSPLVPVTRDDAIAEMPAEEGNAPGKAIDWAQEAHEAARRYAERGKKESTPADPKSISPFREGAPHHKGEQIPTADGRTMVFVSEDCYQLSKEITHITNATNTGKVIQTYCNRRNKKPRGDLFKDLAAYKRLHPDDK